MSEFDVEFLSGSQTYSSLIGSAESKDDHLFSAKDLGNGSMSFNNISQGAILPLLTSNVKIHDSSGVASTREGISIDDWMTNPYLAQFFSTQGINWAEDEVASWKAAAGNLDFLTGESYLLESTSDRINLKERLINNTFWDEYHNLWNGTYNTDNNVELPTHISGDIWGGDGYYTTNFWQYNGNGKVNAQIEKDKETVVVVHGWNRDESKNQPQGYLEELAKTIGSNPDLQVLALDWGEAAIDSTFFLGDAIPLKAAARIKPVAEWAAQMLEQLEIAPEQITLIGHSLGSYVSAEIGLILGKVKNVVALDPAFPTFSYDIDGRETAPGQQRVTDFNQAATNSLALFAGHSFLTGGLAGEAPQAATADNSFAIDFTGGNLFNHHSDVISVFNDAYTSSFLTLPNLTLPPHQHDWYGGWSQKFYFPISGNHEGVIYAREFDDKWDITALKYIDPLGEEQITWNW